jgi:hypothetical protein
MKMKLYLTCILSLLVASSYAALLVHEDFDYTTSDLVDANGGVGWAGTWKGGYHGNIDCTVPLTDGTYDGFDSSPFTQQGKYVHREAAVQNYISREFENPISTTNSHTIYMSFLYFRYSESGSPWSPIGLLAEGNNNGKGVRVGGAHNNKLFLLEVNSEDTNRMTWDNVLSTNEAQFIVSKIVFNEGTSTNDNLYSMVYSEGDTITSSEPVSWTYSRTGKCILPPELKFIYSYIESGADFFVFDDFRIGETWEDVADAPASGTVFMIN